MSARNDTNLTDQQLHLLACVDRTHVRSEADTDDAPVWLKTDSGSHRDITDSIRALHAAGLTDRSGLGWHRTAAGSQIIADREVQSR